MIFFTEITKCANIGPIISFNRYNLDIPVPERSRGKDFTIKMLISLQESNSKQETETEKIQGRYNLRRRKDEGAAKTAPSVEQAEKEPAKVAPVAPLCPPLDFGGKIGEFKITYSVARKLD